MQRCFILLLVIAGSVNCSSKHKHGDPATAKKIKMTNDTIAMRPMPIELTLMEPMRIVFIRDTVPLAELRQFFSNSYEALYSFAGKQQLGAGKAMAFYDNYNDPISVEAAIEVGSIPNHLPGRILTRIVEGGSVVIGHYTGPYDMMVEPYSKLAEWLVENKKVPKGLPFEVYLNNPATVKDSTELRTDIYQPIK